MRADRTITLGLALFVNLGCVVSSLISTELYAQDWQPADSVALSADPAENGSFFTRSDAALAALIVLSLPSTEAVESLDESVTVALSRNGRYGNKWPRWGGRELGRGAVTFALAAAPLAYGLASGDTKARDLGLHSLESVYVAAFLTSLLKMTVGRARPGTSSEPDVFKPFSRSGAYHSFPSDHTSRMFALAATYAQELGDQAPWVPWVAYSLATWTATTRIMDGAHWLTDVTAGAALGILTSHVVERLNHGGSRQGGASLELLPLPDGSIGLGLRVSAR